MIVKRACCGCQIAGRARQGRLTIAIDVIVSRSTWGSSGIERLLVVALDATSCNSAATIVVSIVVVIVIVIMVMVVVVVAVVGGLLIDRTGLIAIPERSTEANAGGAAATANAASL